MASDAHAHPFDLARLWPQAEDARCGAGLACAASAWGEEDFLFNEALAQKSPVPLKRCFGVHPQLPLFEAREGRPLCAASRILLERLAREGRLDAIGECGFDLFNADFRATEAAQKDLFALHLELARDCGLPLVIHARRAMHRVFEYIPALKKLRAVVFHSYAGTAGEAASLLRRGVNAWFSFGNALRLNHKEARRACALLPADRLLFETDAPYQRARGNAFSSYSDVPAIIEEARRLRGGGEDVEARSDASFREVFGV